MTHTIAVSGDTIVSEGVSKRVESGFQRLHELLRETDVTHTHLEGLPTGRDQESYPARRTLGGWLVTPDDVGRELDRLGFDVVSLPGNHTFDHSYAGLFAAWQTLDTAGVEHVGTGWDLMGAREPVYVSAGDATVAFVSATSSFYGGTIAGQTARGDCRPGVNPVRTRHVVGEADWADTVETAHRRGLSAIRRNGDELLVRPPGRGYPLDHYRLDEDLAPGDNYREVLPRDARGLTDAVARANDEADTVVVHLHSHEYAVGGEMEDPATFVRELARAVVDAGADAVVSQGAHTLRGGETYEGAPVFYSLNGLFRMQTPGPSPDPESLRVGPNDDYEPVNLTDDSDFLGGAGVVPVLTAGEDGVESVRLHAVRREEGVARLLSGPDAVDVIEEFEALSERFGATVETDADGGRLRLS